MAEVYCIYNVGMFIASCTLCSFVWSTVIGSSFPDRLLFLADIQNDWH